MPEPKTRPTKESVAKFIAGLEDEERRKDCKKLVTLMQKASGARAQMWGSSIVGFGTYQLKYANGSVLDWPIVGFAPRKQALTLYLMRPTKMPSHLKRLGKHKVSGGCLHVKKLSDIDLDVLAEMVELSVAAKS